MQVRKPASVAHACEPHVAMPASRRATVASCHCCFALTAARYRDRDRDVDRDVDRRTGLTGGGICDLAIRETLHLHKNVIHNSLLVLGCPGIN